MEKIKMCEQQEKFSNDADFGLSRTLFNKKTGEVSELMKVNAYLPSDFIDEKIASIISTLGDAYGQLKRTSRILFMLISMLRQ